MEAKYRRDGAKFIINASNTLGLHYDTTATGVTFYHRFFMIQSFKTFDRWVVASACLLLAGKVEETPKKCKDILKVAKAQLTEQQWVKFGADPKEELLTHERILLQTIKFDLQVQHPYAYLLKFAKALKGDKSKIEKLVQMAWNFINDSLCTTLCLQWEPQCIAVAFLYLGGKLTKYDLQGATASHSKSWWRNFVDTVDSHDLESICHQVLDMYSDKSTEGTQDESVTQDTTGATALGSAYNVPLVPVMVQQASGQNPSGMTIFPATFTSGAQYLISTTVAGNTHNKVPAVSTPSTPTAQQPLAFSTLSVCVAAPPIPQLFINTQAPSPLVQPVTLLGYQPQVLAPSPMPPQYRPPPPPPPPTTPVQGMAYTQLHTHIVATPPRGTAPGTTLGTPTLPQTYSQVWRR